MNGNYYYFFISYALYFVFILFYYICHVKDYTGVHSLQVMCFYLNIN